MNATTSALIPEFHEPLHEKLRAARIAQGEHIAAIVNIREAATLRLQGLRDELEPIVASSSAARGFVALAVVPGNPPRLWIDMVSYVMMAPDPRTYRFQRDAFDGHEIMLESSNRQEVADAITNFIAHRLIERERHLSAAAPLQSEQHGKGYDTAALVLAWLSGLSVGACAILLAVNSMTR